MPLSQHLIGEFQVKARASLESLATEFKLKLEQKDELTFALIRDTLEIRLYVYPSHIPSVNVTLLPTGDQWDKWRRESNWGSTGIWLAHLAAFHKVEARCPAGRFQTEQELRSRIDALVLLLSDIGRDLLRGDLSDLPHVAAYVDDKVLRRRCKESLVGILSSSTTRPGPK